LAAHNLATSRLRETEGELAEAEDALLQFYTSNRQYENSPALLTEERRLRQHLNQRVQLQVSLSLEEEKARIENRRNTPFITVIDAPENHAIRTGLRAPVAAPIGFLVGGLVAILIAIPLDTLQHQRVAAGSSDKTVPVPRKEHQAVTHDD